MASESKFELEISGCSQEVLVHSFNASEELSHPYRIDLKLACEDKLSFDSAMHKEAVIEITTTEEEPRYLHGVISNLSRSGFQGKYLYDATIVPYLAILSMSTDCRIFQNMTVVEIVKKVLEPYKELGSDKYRFLAMNGNGDKLKRTYCVQYRESDLDFISRILSEEGIYYYFEHSQDKHVIVFSDNTMGYQEISGDSTIAFNASDMNTGTECITSFDISQHLTPGEVVHSDYNFEKSSAKLKTKAKKKSVFNLEIYDHPGNYQDPSVGNKISKTHLESVKTFEKKADGCGTCPRLSAGYTFKLDKGKDEQYLVTSVEHAGFQPQVLEEYADGATSYSNSFTVIPSKTVYRPVAHSKPVISGLQSAVVVGPKGEEIHTDEHGRVRVQFHWDRKGKKDENSSCMLRVVQSWGGGGFGAQFIPRIGDEVIVDFLEGDPDRPIVTGCVYNSDNQPINSLKKSITQSGFKTKTHKGEGGHELRFDDKNGSQEIFLHSQKDWNVNVNNRKGQTIGGDCCTVINKNKEQSIGGDSYTLITGKQTEHAKDIVLAADATITIVSGTSSIVISPAGIKINGLKVDINDGSSVPMPAKQPVAGSTSSGSGGASKGGGAGGGAGKPDVIKQETKTEPKKTEPAKETAPAKETVPAEDNTELGSFKGDKPISGGWTEMPNSSVAKSDAWNLGAMSGKTSLPGDLVSSASSAVPANLQSNISTARSLGNPSAIQNMAKQQVQNRASQMLDSAKGKIMDKTGLSTVSQDAAKELGKLNDLLKFPKK